MTGPTAAAVQAVNVNNRMKCIPSRLNMVNFQLFLSFGQLRLTTDVGFLPSTDPFTKSTQRRQRRRWRRIPTETQRPRRSAATNRNVFEKKKLNKTNKWLRICEWMNEWNKRELLASAPRCSHASLWALAHYSLAWRRRTQSPPDGTGAAQFLKIDC